MITSSSLRLRVFLHFFDIHFLEEKGYYGLNLTRQVEYECNMAMRISVLAADEVIIPAASFFESAMCYKIVSQLNDIYPAGIIKLVGSGASVVEYFDDKLSQYVKNSLQYKSYKQNLKCQPELIPPFLSRRNSASSDIKKGWIGKLDGNGLKNVFDGSGLHLASNFEDAWRDIPDKLEARAFIVPHVEPMLFSHPIKLMLKNRLHGVINEQYFGSFTREFCSGILSDLNYLEASYSIPSYGRNLPFNAITTELRKTPGLLLKIERAKGSDLLKLKYNPVVMVAVQNAIEYYEQKVMQMNTVRKIDQLALLAEATVGIITALPEEFAAVQKVFGCSEIISAPGAGAGRMYSIAKIANLHDEIHTVAIAMLSDMGNNSAAIRASLMKSHCPKVEHIIMTGIAGAVPNHTKPDDHVRLGDIVVSDRQGVIQYDLDKESTGFTEHRYAPRPPSASLTDAHRLLSSNALLGKFPWDEYIEKAVNSLGYQWQRPSEELDVLKETSSEKIICHPVDPSRRFGCPRVFQGPIASANKLLKNPVKRDALRDQFRVKAVEMEASGVADATWTAEIGYYVIRGTCDYCDQNKADAWHFYASVIAAAYTRALIEAMPT